MPRADAEHGAAAVKVEEAVVCVGDVEPVGNFGLVVVAVSDWGALAEVVQVAVGDCDEVLETVRRGLPRVGGKTYRCSGHVDELVVEVSIVCPVIA